MDRATREKVTGFAKLVMRSFDVTPDWIGAVGVFVGYVLFMQENPYSVNVVVDPEFSGNLMSLLHEGPIWMANTLHNRQLAQAVWESSPGRTHLDGITVFTVRIERNPANWLIGNMDTIDLHHGVYSASPAYTVLRVIGVPISNEIRSAPTEYGFDVFEPEQDGFRATRAMRVLSDIVG